METATLNEKALKLKGGEFLIKHIQANETYIPEDINEEQNMFKQMAREFVQKEIHPHINRIDKGDHGLVVDLLQKAGELGLLGASLPEEFGGMGVNFNTDSFLSEEIGQSGSFSVAFAAHTGIGTLPILYYGTNEQKEKYLPGMASGQLKAAYCLTEPGSGSDALAAKTKATLTEDGAHYIIEGQKMWITNSGFADVFIVFAQVDGDKFTGFIVPGDAENIELGNEEDKLGIKGSSTRQVFFQGVKVPVENVLGEIGKGHKIAFNVLNIGRYKLAAMTNGGSKLVTTMAIKYANEREQFNQPIANFGAIKHKLGEMGIKNWISEAATYRASGLINEMIDSLKENGTEGWKAKLIAAEEYSIECALLKVMGSEFLDYVVDENVQVHGGNGFSEEYNAARAYRDARINRIFEGTNEINRLLGVGMLMKKALKGQVSLFDAAKNVQAELMSGEIKGYELEGIISDELSALYNAKKSVLMVLGAAAMQFQQKLEEEQEILMSISNMMIDIFAAESGLLRAKKLAEKNGEENATIYINIAKVFLSDALERIYIDGKHAVSAFAPDGQLKPMLKGLKLLTRMEPVKTVSLRQSIAEKLIANNEYKL